MADYFTSEHFKLLNKWKGQKRDNSNPDQTRAYKELQKAYEVTEAWAKQLKAELFPIGIVDCRKRPTNQANNFQAYNWAKIYPSLESPKALAYTVGIEPDHGFVVKIDLVDTHVDDPVLRQRYEEIRGMFSSSPIVATKSVSAGLEMDFTDLVDWSKGAIKQFKISYDDLALQLGLSAEEDQGGLMRHFQGHGDFVERQPLWSNPTTEMFGRLARAVNDLGLDWWFTRATNSQLRFGRKEKNTERGNPVGWLFLRKDGIRVSWSAFAGLDALKSTDITSELVQLFESADKDEGSWPSKLGAHAGRKGYWPDDYDIEDEPKIDTPPKNVIYYGPPGTGKTFKLQELLKNEYTDMETDEKYFEFVTFHQSYGYEEFVEGLRPVITKPDNSLTGSSETETVVNGEVRYEIKPGVFLRLCDQARNNPSRQYAMVIDEINRGNVSKIFGELITLMETDKRAGAKHPVTVTLPYSGERFSIPLNIDLIGTMNTADRSLALLDTALRRRFEFTPIMPDPSVLKDFIVTHNSVDINIELMLTMLNKRIESLYDRDHTIGHAYFTGIKDIKVDDRFDELKAVFKNKIIPLLEEYFFEDWQKIRLVLGDNQKTEVQKNLQFVHEINRENDLSILFGGTQELDQYATRSRFQPNPDALDEPQAYVGIYRAKSAVTSG